MKFWKVWVFSLVGAVIAAPSGTHDCIGPKCAPQSDALVAQGLENLKAFVAKQGYGNTTCTLEKAAVRKEWYVRVGMDLETS